MLSLKKIIIGSSAALAMTGASVGVAQAQAGRYYDRGYDRGHEQRVDRLSTSFVDGLDWRIDNAVREGRISWREARDLKNDLNQVKPLAWRYQTGQARPWEIQRLQRTVDRITSEVRS
jgi:hypothetical protein